MSKMLLEAGGWTRKRLEAAVSSDLELYKQNWKKTGEDTVKEKQVEQF